VSGVSPAAGRGTGEFNRKSHCEVLYKIHGIGYKVDGAGRMQAIKSDTFRTRPRESGIYRGRRTSMTTKVVTAAPKLKEQRISWSFPNRPLTTDNKHFLDASKISINRLNVL
jgi:hypothetical protein